MSNSFRPSRDGSLTVETTRPITFPRYIQFLASGSRSVLRNLIDNANDCRVNGYVFASLRHPRRTALDNDDSLSETGIDRIDGYEVTLLVIAVGVHRPPIEKLLTSNPSILPLRT